MNYVKLKPSPAPLEAWAATAFTCMAFSRLVRLLAPLGVLLRVGVLERLLRAEPPRLLTLSESWLDLLDLPLKPGNKMFCKWCAFTDV